MKVVDAETGEIARVIALPEDAHVYVRRRSEYRGRGSRDRRKFTKVYSTAWQAVFAKHLFSPQESHTLLFLGAYCEPESNAVVDEKGRPMTRRDIAQHLGWSDKNMRRILASLQAKNAIFYGGSSGDERFFVNPALFGKGAVVNATTQRMFDDRKVQLIESARGMLEFLRIGRGESNIVCATSSSVHGN